MAVAVDPRTRRVYVANRDSDTVSVIDGTSTALLSPLAAGAQPTALAIDSANQRMLADASSNLVSVLQI